MKVAIIIGSDSDWPIMKPAYELLSKFGIEAEVHVASAHRTPAKVRELVTTAPERGVSVFIAAAGAAGVHRHHFAHRPVPDLLGGRCAARRRGAVHPAVQYPAGDLRQLCPQPYF